MVVMFHMCLCRPITKNVGINNSGSQVDRLGLFPMEKYASQKGVGCLRIGPHYQNHKRDEWYAPRRNQSAINHKHDTHSATNKLGHEI